MKRKLRLSATDYEQIIQNRGEGLDNEESASVLGVSAASVGYIDCYCQYCGKKLMRIVVGDDNGESK